MIQSAKTLARGTLGAALVCSLSACPNGEVVRPDDPSYADTVGGTGTPVIEAHGEPLVVDWRPEHRGDLEIAMKEGVAVVPYTKTSRSRGSGSPGSSAVSCNKASPSTWPSP